MTTWSCFYKWGPFQQALPQQPVFELWHLLEFLPITLLPTHAASQLVSLNILPPTLSQFTSQLASSTHCGQCSGFLTHSWLPNGISWYPATCVMSPEPSSWSQQIGGVQQLSCGHWSAQPCARTEGQEETHESSEKRAWHAHISSPACGTVFSWSDLWTQGVRVVKTAWHWSLTACN